MNTRMIAILLLLVSMGASVARIGYAQIDTRNGIHVLKTTRAELAQKFNDYSGNNSTVSYHLPNGTLFVNYYDSDHCRSSDGLEAEWNVPQETVVETLFHPNQHPKIEELHLDLSRFRTERESPHVPELISYIDDVEGVDYTFAPTGELVTVRYFAGKKYDSQRCPRKK